MEKGDKQGQMKISFGMIFSIILIIIFIAFASYGISKFLNLQKKVQMSAFANDFQGNVNEIYNSPQSKDTFSYIVPKKITRVCFKSESGSDNVELWGNKGFEQSYEIKNLNVPIPFCIATEEGRVEINLEKKYGENFATIIKE